MDGPVGLGRALGFVRCATRAFVAEADVSGEALFLASECLDLESLFAELGVVPEPVDVEVSAVEALARASTELAGGRPFVPLGLWAAVQALRARAVR